MLLVQLFENREDSLLIMLVVLQTREIEIRKRVCKNVSVQLQQSFDNGNNRTLELRRLNHNLSRLIFKLHFAGAIFENFLDFVRVVNLLDLDGVGIYALLVIEIVAAASTVLARTFALAFF